ncbi:hypothetical protein BC940DRAFT_303429 [Gongronella butleri]|nr:hypothetical protein BC940DRAFT_303429 [Gongronella butleri]
MSASNALSTLSRGHDIPLTQDTHHDVWRQSFAHLSLRDLSSLSLTCRSFFDIVRSLPVWEQTLRRLGYVPRHGVLPMADVMYLQQRRGICENCGRLGIRQGSDAILSMQLRNGERTPGLCRECRSIVSGRYPPVEQVVDLGLPGLMTKAQVRRNLFLRGVLLDLLGGPINDEQVRLEDALPVALDEHGGYAGILALRSAAESDRRDASARQAERGPSTPRQRRRRRLQPQNMSAAPR